MHRVGAPFARHAHDLGHIEISGNRGCAVDGQDGIGELRCQPALLGRVTDDGAFKPLRPRRAQDARGDLAAVGHQQPANRGAGHDGSSSAAGTGIGKSSSICA